MKTALLLIVYFACLTTSAQLTQGQVYNYEIGDIIETKYEHNSAPPISFQHNTVTDKVINGDVITYTFERKTRVSGPGANYPLLTTSTETLVINVTYGAAHYQNMQTCLPYVYTMGVGNCGQQTWNKNSNSDGSCFEPPVWDSHLYEGMGGPYYYGNDATNPGWFIRHSLVYAKTAHAGECGTEFKWWQDPPEIAPEEPVEKQIVNIWDYLGRKVNFKVNLPLIYEYDDGTFERVMVVE